MCGIDVGLSSDFFGVALVGRSLADSGALLVGAVDGINPAGVRVRKASQESLEDVRDREDSMFARAWGLAEPYSPTRGVADSHKGGPVRSYFGRQGCRVELVPPTGTLQMQQFVALKARLEDGSLRAWAQPQLIQDLRRVRTTEGGKIHLPKFRGSHCDTVVALASAAWELKDGTPGQLLIPQGRLPERRSNEQTSREGVRPRPAAIFPPGTPAWQKRLTRQARR